MNHQHISIRVIVFGLFLALCAIPAPYSFAADHTPQFTWQVRGGVVNAEQWIYDGETPIALFENRTVEQPGQQLMFFNRVPRPIVLRKIKLTPDGEPLIECIQLYSKAGAIVTDCLVGLEVAGQGTDRLVVTFVTEDPWKVMTSSRTLTVTYDARRKTYMYDFQGKIVFNSPEFFNGSGTAIEFCDPWFTGCPGPAVEFPGMWKRRYQTFIWEAGDGTVNTAAINHFTTSCKSGGLKRDGMFLTAYEPDGNPAIQFVGETADRSSVSICWWGYDFHLSRNVTPDELFAPVPVNFRIFQCPGDVALDLLKQGTPMVPGPKEWGGDSEFPVYERISSFDKGIGLNGYFDGPVDPFPWTREGDGASWDKTSGRTDSFSMKISRKDPGLTRWQTFQGDGEGYFTAPWNSCKGFRVSCWVKTENVTGRGSTIALQYEVPNSPQRYPVVTARKISGTNGWTKIEAEIGPTPLDGPEIGCLMIMLQQDGSGTTWFDDLEVSPLR